MKLSGERNTTGRVRRSPDPSLRLAPYAIVVPVEAVRVVTAHREVPVLDVAAVEARRRGGCRLSGRRIAVPPPPPPPPVVRCSCVFRSE